MGKTVHVSGFLLEVHATEVRQAIERVTGSGSVHAVSVKKMNNKEEFYALVEFTQEIDEEKILTLSTQVEAPYPLKFYNWSKETESARDVDGLLMYFGFLESPETLRYLLSVCASFGSSNHSLHFSVEHSGEYYRVELPYENIGQINVASLTRRGLKASFDSVEKGSKSL